MIVVDSSVWISYFNGAATPKSDLLHAALGAEPILMGDLVLAEVLQGFRDERDYRRARDLLTALPFAPMVGRENALKAASHYRALRAKGVTVRKTTDLLIATYCIESRLPLLTEDRDFAVFGDHLGLSLL